MLIEEFNADINLKNNGYAPIHLALMRRRKDTKEIVEILIKHNVDIDIKDRDGDTALHKAVFNEYVEVIELLVKNKASTSLLGSRKLTPYSLAKYIGRESAEQKLLELGVTE